MDINHNLPSGLVVDTLDVLYIVENDPVMKTLLSESSMDGFIDRMEEVAYAQTEFDVEDTGAGKMAGVCALWKPQGNIKIMDNYLNSNVPIEHLKVVINKGVKVSVSKNDSNGDFESVFRFRGKIRYKIKLKHRRFLIRELGNTVTIVSNKMDTHWNKVVSDQFDKYCILTFRAVRYYFKGDIKGMTRPFTFGRKIKYEMSRANNGVYLGRVNSNSKGRKVEMACMHRSEAKISGIAFHETQHTVQFKLNLPLPSRVSETMSVGVETMLNRNFYPNWSSLSPNSSTNVELGYTHLVRDLIDSGSQNGLYDQCGGYTLGQIESALYDLQPSDNAISWTSWKNSLIANYPNNPTKNNVPDLFDYWDE